MKNKSIDWNVNKWNVNMWNAKSYLFISILIIVVLLINSYDVHALGISPSRKIQEYTKDPITVRVKVLNNEHKNMLVIITPSGDLAKYAKFLSNKLILNSSDAEKSFEYIVELPDGLKPGTNDLDILFTEVPLDVPDNPEPTIISTVSITHQLRIDVPYPGIYADGFMYLSTGNVNDTATFTVDVVNRGSQEIKQLQGELIIKGPTNEEIYRLSADKINNLAAGASTKVVINWLANTNPGLYYAEFVADYDGQHLSITKEFNIGSSSLEIRDVKVKNFRLGAIAKFDTQLISRWNEPIQNVYGEMQIIDPEGNVLTSFNTNPTELKSSMTTTITGYWDTQEVKVGNYDLRVIVHYGDKQAEKLFKTVVGIDSIDVNDNALLGNVVASKNNGGSMSLLYILVAASIVFNIIIFVYFKHIKKKSEL